jgi:RHS repeat-associated protein
LEAVIDVNPNTRHTVLNDRLGNALGYAPVLLPSSFQWSGARFHSCGPKVAYETPFLSSGAPLIQTVGWQGQRRDLTGLYYWNARPYDPVERRYLTLDPLGFGPGPWPYGYGNGDTANFFDPDGMQAWQITPPQAYWDANLRNMLNSPEYQRGFQMGMAQGAWLGTKLTVGVAVAIYTGGAAAPYLAAWGASTPFVVVGSGMVGAAAGDVTIQGMEWAAGERQQYSPTQTGVSTLLGGGISYGVNRIFSPNVLSGQIGARQLGNLGHAQAVDDIGAANVQGQQIRFQTPGGNPTLDILARDASTASGFRGVEVKVGNATLTNPQEFGYPFFQTGNAIPVGTAARQAGLTLGQPLGPTPVDIWRYLPYELLPLSPGAGAAIGSGATTLGGMYFQQDPTGIYVKRR